MRRPSILVLIMVFSLAFGFPPNDIWAIQEVWYGIENSNYVLRRTFDGEYLPSFSASSGVSSIEMVGQEVWYGAENGGIIRRDYDGTYLSSLSTEGAAVTDMTVIPEPITLILPGLGAVMVRRKR